MTPEGRQKLKGLLAQQEECKFIPSDDDISYHYDKLFHFLDFFKDLNENRQIILIILSYNFGVLGFLGFKEIINALESHDYERAAEEILNKLEEVKKQLIIFANIVRTGEL